MPTDLYSSLNDLAQQFGQLYWPAGQQSPSVWGVQQQDPQPQESSWMPDLTQLAGLVPFPIIGRRPFGSKPLDNQMLMAFRYKKIDAKTLNDYITRNNIDIPEEWYTGKLQKYGYDELREGYQSGQFSAPQYRRIITSRGMPGMREGTGQPTRMGWETGTGGRGAPPVSAQVIPHPSSFGGLEPSGEMPLE